MVAVAIRRDHAPEELRALARRERDGRVCSRLLALANALDGMSREEAARLAGMDRQTLRAPPRSADLGPFGDGSAACCG
jgi:putative transposase